MTPAPEERRTARRYPVKLKLACWLLRKGSSVNVGIGTTRNMSSTGMLIDLDQSLTAGDVMEAMIHWPAGSQIMHVLGNVVRSDSRGTAVQIVHYKFAVRRVRKRARAHSQEQRPA